MKGRIILHINSFKLAFLILTLSLLTGCSEYVMDYVSDFMSNASESVSEVTDSAPEDSEENPTITPHEYAVNTFNEVFELVQKKDTQAIFDMFSEYARENVDIMPDIEKLVEFIDGEVTEMRHVGASNDYMSVRDGVTVRAAYTASTYITTDNETLYWVKVGVITEDEDETKLGLYYIYVLNSTLSQEHTDAWVEWRTNHFDEKEKEPPIPENMEIQVSY